MAKIHKHNNGIWRAIKEKVENLLEFINIYFGGFKDDGI
jgi:hypothetical protein